MKPHQHRKTARTRASQPHNETQVSPVTSWIADPALTFEDVTFAYPGGEQQPVVEGVSIELRRGEMVALLGPNGAGKSTLLGMATGALRPQAGHMVLAGTNIARLPRRQVAQIVGVVPQDFSVQFAYTVRQLVQLGRAPHQGILGITGPRDEAAIEEALLATGTATLAERTFNELSGGERQRVVVALALAQEPAILLLDEPTAHLDIKHQIEVLELLQRLNAERGLTVLAALHDLNLAARYFGRLWLFRKRILADGPPAAVLDPAMLSRVYDTPVHVGILRDEEHLSVHPPGSRAIATTSTTNPAAVHVLAGGGSGDLVLRALADNRVPFSVGPLSAGDSEATLAQRLASEVIVQPPFTPLDDAQQRVVASSMSTRRAVVVCPFPIGAGNVALLDLASDAVRMGKRVILLEPLDGEWGEADAFRAITGRDFTGVGAQKYRGLLAAGACWARSVAEAAALAREAAGAEARNRRSAADH